MDGRPDVLARLEDLRRQGAVKMALAADKASAALSRSSRWSRRPPATTPT